MNNNQRKIKSRKLNKWEAFKTRLAVLFSSKPKLTFKYTKKAKLKIIWFNAHCWLISLLVLLLAILALIFLGMSIKTFVKFFIDEGKPIMQYYNLVLKTLIPGIISMLVGLLGLKNLNAYIKDQTDQVAYLISHPEDFDQLKQSMMKLREIEQKKASKK